MKVKKSNYDNAKKNHAKILNNLREGKHSKSNRNPEVLTEKKRINMTTQNI
jgi:hypothetical protein